MSESASPKRRPVLNQSPSSRQPTAQLSPLHLPKTARSPRSRLPSANAPRGRIWHRKPTPMPAPRHWKVRFTGACSTALPQSTTVPFCASRFCPADRHRGGTLCRFSRADGQSGGRHGHVIATHSALRLMDPIRALRPRLPPSPKSCSNRCRSP